MSNSTLLGRSIVGQPSREKYHVHCDLCKAARGQRCTSPGNNETTFIIAQWTMPQLFSVD